MVGTNDNRKTRRIELRGQLRQRTTNGVYSYRLTVANGTRKEFFLRTNNYDEAVRKASDLDSIWLAPTQEVALAQMNAIRGYSTEAPKITFDEAWEKYRTHPDRATPSTFNAQLSYNKSFRLFAEYATGQTGGRHTTIGYVNEVTPRLCQEFAFYLKTQMLAVYTHNRRIKQLRRIFDCIKDYYEGENPFRSKSLLRSEREERGKVLRRLAFTKEQEEQLLLALSPDNHEHRLRNKEEIRIAYIIGMFTGQRLKDCVLLQWQDIDMERRSIWVKQFKTGKEVTIPLAPELYDALLEAKKWKNDQYVLPKTAARYNTTDAEGKNIGNNLIDLDVLRPIRWIGLEPSVRVPGRKRKMTIYGFHSLRHSFASFCAEAGVPKAVLLSILGTDSKIADKYYTHVSEESQRKAIEAISSRSTPASQEKIDRVLNLLMPDGKQLDTTADSTIQQVLEILRGNVNLIKDTPDRPDAEPEYLSKFVLYQKKLQTVTPFFSLC